MTKTTASDVKQARVVVEIGDKEYTLIPSPEAILGLSDKYGGLGPLNQALGNFSIRAIGDIVIAGLGLEGKEAKDMMTTVVAAPNKMDSIKKLSEFIGILANGGRALKADKTNEEGGNGPL